VEALDGSMHFRGAQAEIGRDDGHGGAACGIAAQFQGDHDVLGLQVHTYILYSRFANSEYVSLEVRVGN